LSLVAPESVTLGGDRYPGSSFIDHLLHLEQNLDCKVLVRLHEVKAMAEYRAIGAGDRSIIKEHLIANRSMRKIRLIVPDTPEELLQAGINRTIELKKERGLLSFLWITNG